MTGIDLIVLIPWAVAGAVLIIVCVRLQISSGRSQRVQRPGGPAQPPPGLKPADPPGTAPADPVSAPDAAQPDPVSAPDAAQPDPASAPGRGQDTAALSHRDSLGWLPDVPAPPSGPPSR